MSLKMSNVLGGSDAAEQEWMRRAMLAQEMEQDSGNQSVEADGEEGEQEQVHLTTEGDGSDHYMGEQESEEIVYQNIQEIIPGLFIGDYTAAIDGELLKQKNIQCVVAASAYISIAHAYIMLNEVSIVQCASGILFRK